MPQTILLFEISNEKKQPLTQLCRRLSIQTKFIFPKDYQKPLGTLAGIQGFSKKNIGIGSKAASPLETQFSQNMPEIRLNAEMLVFSGMNTSQVDLFLDAYKQQGLPRIGLKAILTPYNVRWTPVQLCQELKQEQESMKY